MYDYIARHPVSGSRKADEWIKDLKSTGPGSFKTGNPDFKNISQAVKKEEMWDSNLLQLNKQGEVVGGFLKTAAEKGLPLSKMDLLYIVEKAPVNNLKMRKLQTNVKLVDEAEDVTRQMNLGLQDLRDKVNSYCCFLLFENYQDYLVYKNNRVTYLSMVLITSIELKVVMNILKTLCITLNHYQWVKD